ncbi:hypothetical protein O3M35_007076 [Rhynocoris fuscipes]|uniref:Reverse transcriptase n=1 Tax=Rhynocoris fuscipes TaxID=488301 RepID=A0AAW1DAU9_9HEMI
MFTLNKIYSQEHFTFLGITLDTRLSWKDHINALAAKLSRLNNNYKRSIVLDNYIYKPDSLINFAVINNRKQR